MLNLQQLSTFVTVVAEGSMTAAADKLFLTQPAVSQQIRNLEEDLSVHLLVRGVRQIKPTPFGEILFEHAKKILQTVSQAEVAVKSMSAELKGDVRIGTLNSIGVNLMSPLVNRLMKNNPDLNMEVEYDDGNLLYQELLKNELDMVILPEVSKEYGIQEDPNYNKKFLFKEEMWLVASAREQQLATQMNFDQLAEHPYVDFSDEFPGFLKAQAEMFHKLNLKLKKRFSSSNVGTLKRVIESGLGWGFLPSHTIRKQVRAGRLKRFFVSDFSYWIDFYAYFPKKNNEKVLYETLCLALSQTEG